MNVPLDKAVVNKNDDKSTVNVFPYTFPTLDKSHDCGTQTVTILEPDTPYISGPVSDFISISSFDADIDGFNINVSSSDPVEG